MRSSKTGSSIAAAGSGIINKQQATISELKRELSNVVAHSKEQDSKIQQVSAQLELNTPALQVACPPAVASHEDRNNP
jgi:hypothetical protein